MNGWMDKQMDRISPNSTGLCPLSGPLLHIHVNYQILKQGKGTPDHMMPLGDWFYFLKSIKKQLN